MAGAVPEPGVPRLLADIGGTNARFARAALDEKGVPTLGTVRKYKVEDYPSLTACWAAFAADEKKDGAGHLPDAASIAFASSFTSISSPAPPP